MFFMTCFLSSIKITNQVTPNGKIICKQTGRYRLFFEYLNMCDHMVYGLLPVACLYWHLRFKEKKVFTVY